MGAFLRSFIFVCIFVILFASIFNYTNNIRSFDSTLGGVLDFSLNFTELFGWEDILSTNAVFYDNAIVDSEIFYDKSKELYCIKLCLKIEEGRDLLTLYFAYNPDHPGDYIFSDAKYIDFLGVFLADYHPVYASALSDVDLVFDNFLQEVRVSFCLNDLYYCAVCSYDYMYSRGLEYISEVEYAS